MNKNQAKSPQAKPGFVADDVLIAYGDKASVKSVAASEGATALPNAADGYLVRFTSCDDPDITSLRDFFTKSTYFGEAEKVPVYFHHGMALQITQPDGSVKTFGPGKTKIGVGSLKSDDTGIFIDAVLDESVEYCAAVQDLLNQGKLGWSSGSASHLVLREPVTDDSGTTKAHEIKQWLLAEASLTHTPAEPRNVANAVQPAIKSIKSLLGQYGQYSWEYQNGYGDGTDWDPVAKMGSAAADVLVWRLERAIDNILDDEDMTPAQQTEAIGGVFDEAKVLLTKMVGALAGIETITADDMTESTKSAFVKFVPLTELPAKKSAPGALSLADHGDKALGALKSFTDRIIAVKQFRTAKSGRTISAANEAKLKEAQGIISDLLGDNSAVSGGDSESAAPAEVPSAEPTEKTVAVTPAETPVEVAATDETAPGAESIPVVLVEVLPTEAKTFALPLDAIERLGSLGVQTS